MLSILITVGNVGQYIDFPSFLVVVVIAALFAASAQGEESVVQKIWKWGGPSRLARLDHRDNRNLWDRLLCFWRYVANRNGLSRMFLNNPIWLLF